MLVEGHEEGVDHDAERDEEIDERVEDDEREELKTKKSGRKFTSSSVALIANYHRKKASSNLRNFHEWL